MQARRVAGVPLWAPLLALAMWLAILAYRAEADPSLRPWSVLTLWLASLVVFLASAYAVPKGQVRCRASPRWSKLEVVALLGFVIAALLVRTIALDRVPQSFGGDEAELGIQARAVLYGELRDPFTTGWAGHPTVWSFVQAASLGVFGDDVFGVRMIAALLGAATVPLLYVFARRSYGRELALVAATLLTTYQLHVHYSRIGVNSVGDAFWLLLGLVLLLEGLRRASPLLMASAGVSAGLAQHFYLGSRLVPLVLASVVAHQLLVNRAAVRPSVRYLPLAALGFLLGYGPGVRVPLYHWEEYNARISQVGVFQSGWFDSRRALGDSAFDIARHQLGQSFGAFTHISDRAVNYLPEMPFLDTVSALFFVIGLVVVALEWRRAESGALIAWIVGAAVTGGVLLVDPPHSHRYVIVAPALCIVVALGIVRTAGAVIRLTPRARPAWIAAASVLVLGIAFWNFDFYFREYSSRYMYAGFHRGEEATALGRYLDGEGDGAYVYFLGAPVRFLSHGSIRFLAPRMRGIDVEEQLVDVQQVPEGPRSAPECVRGPARIDCPELAVVRSVHPEGRSGAGS